LGNKTFEEYVGLQTILKDII